MMKLLRWLSRRIVRLGSSYPDFLSRSDEWQKKEKARRDKWDKRWLGLVKEVMTWSSDRSTQCACVLVQHDNSIISLGYNGLPRRVDYTEERHERPEKYYWFEHAERNALYNANRIGANTEGATAYVSGPPCHDCARGLVQAGIYRVVIPKMHNFLDKASNERWKESCDRAMQMFKEAGVWFDVVDVGVRTDGN